jgi:hypothetical protein
VAEITKQTISSSDRAFAFSAAAEAGDSTPYDRLAKLVVRNGSSAPITVTVASEAAVAPPTGPEDLVVTVAAGEVAVIGDSGNVAYKDSNGDVVWTYGDHEDVFVAVVQF